MKRLSLLFVALVLLAACAPRLFRESLLSGTREAPGIAVYTAYTGPTLIASSTARIEKWEPAAACRYEPISEGADVAVRCSVKGASPTNPVVIKLYTSGTVSANIVDGLVPKTKFVIVNK